MDSSTINQLQSIGVSIINVSGRGGTNFAAIEDRRNHTADFSFLDQWGQTTLESMLEAREARTKDTQIIASGGICSPLDVIKAGILGANAVGVAGYFLKLSGGGNFPFPPLAHPCFLRSVFFPVEEIPDQQTFPRYGRIASGYVYSAQ